MQYGTRVRIHLFNLFSFEQHETHGRIVGSSEQRRFVGGNNVTQAAWLEAGLIIGSISSDSRTATIVEQ